MSASQTVIVTDAGFTPAPAREIVTLADLTDQTSVDLSNTDDPEALVGRLDQLTLILKLGSVYPFQR